MKILNKVVIVEGLTDKKRVKEVIDEPINIICTHGTMGVEKMDELLEEIYGKKVFILVDQDNEGKRIRKWFKKYISEAKHIYIEAKYTEVARCPRIYLANVLNYHGFKVKKDLMLKGNNLNYDKQRKIERNIQAL